MADAEDLVVLDGLRDEALPDLCLEVELLRRGEEVLADAPLPIRGRIEARGVGLMTCPASGRPRSG